MEINLAEIERLIGVVERYGLTELTISEEDVTISIIAEPAAAAMVPEAVPAFYEMHAAPATRPHSEQEKNRIRIESPMAGVFYRASSPDVPPLIEVGDHIEVGHPIGIIEAMKVFTEIPSEVSGTVVEIPAANGQLVRAGDTLVVLEIEKG